MTPTENGKSYENLTKRISSVNLEIEKLRKCCKNQCKPLNLCNKTKNKTFRSCLELFNHGCTKSGKYKIKPFLNVTKIVYCDQDTEGGGWTVFLRNAHGSVSFNKKWDEYKNGFGSVEHDFWLGNEFIYNATKVYNSHISRTKELYIMVVGTDNKTFYAMYKNFAILSEAKNYTLQVSHHFKGNMGDALEYHNNMQFSTKDRDNDLSTGDCSNNQGGYGWWFNKCYLAYLTRMTLDVADLRLKPAPRWYFTYYKHQDLKNAKMMFREMIA